MVQNKSYKYRIYPNETQKQLMSKTFGCARFVWNHQVDAFNHYREGVVPMTIKELRVVYPWMAEVSATAMQYVEIIFRQFKQQYFSKTRKIKMGRPKFKKRGQSRDSFKLSYQKFKLLGNKIQLEKIGKVTIIVDRQIPKGAKLYSVTISRDKVGDFFASINFEVEQEPIYQKTNKIIGLDLGLKDFYSLSDGTKVSNPRFFSESQRELKRAQQHLNRKQLGSNRRAKQKIKVAKIHRKIARQREFFLHNLSTKLVREFDIIAIEDLNISGMKKLYGKSVSDVAWSTFINQLKYKALWNNKEVVQINRFKPSTKICSECQRTVDFLTLADRSWTCPSCGTEHDRDVNAARSILVEAVGVTAAQQTWRDHKTI